MKETQSLLRSNELLGDAFPYTYLVNLLTPPYNHSQFNLLPKRP